MTICPNNADKIVTTHLYLTCTHRIVPLCDDATEKPVLGKKERINIFDHEILQNMSILIFSYPKICCSLQKDFLQLFIICKLWHLYFNYIYFLREEWR